MSANTNFLISGTTNTMTHTMATLTGNRIFTLPDANSNSVQPYAPVTNQWLTGINSSGVITSSAIASTQLSDISSTPATNTQILISNGTTYSPCTVSAEATITNAGVVTLSNSAVIAKVLTSFASVIGTITSADSLFTAIEKIASITVNAPFRTQATSSTLLLTDQGGEVQCGGNNLTLTLPPVGSMQLGKQFGITINTVGFTGTNINGGSATINGAISPFSVNGVYQYSIFYTTDNIKWLMA